MPVSRRRAIPRLSTIACACIAMVISQPAHALEFQWVSSTLEGTWSTVSNWFNADGANQVPGTGDTVVFSQNAQTSGAQAKDVFIQQVDLALTGSNTFLGVVTNTGTLTVGNNSSYGVLYFGADTVLKGSGQTVLNSNGYVYATNNAKLTIDAGHTVRGNGDINYNGASGVSVVNRGTVIADGGTLSIGVSVFDNTAGTVKVADGSRLLVNGNLTGGALQSLGSTAVISGGQYASTAFSGDFNYQSISFVDVTMNGASVLTGTSYLSGSLSNTGTLTVGNNSSYGVLYFGADTVLKGSGQTVLNSNGYVYATNNAKLTIDAGHTVRGNGDINYNGASGVSVVNRGTVIADGGTLSIGVSVFDNTAGTVKVADGSRLLVNGNLTGGALQSLGSTAVISGGQYASTAFSGDFNYQSISFVDVTMNGASVLTGTSYLSGSLSNTGTLTVGNNSSYGVLYFGADTVLKGSGQTVLNSNGHVYASGTNAKLTIDADHTVSGNGDISYNGASAVSVINKGTVIADGGTLNISVPVFDNTAGTVKVTDGSRLSVSGVLKGGRLQGGTLGTSLLSGSTLDGVSLSGLLVTTGSLDLNNTITNTGTLTVGSNSSSGSLYFGAGTVLKGGGQTILSSNGHVYASGTNAKLTIDADHTVRGNGDISYNGASAVSVVNKGTVIAEGGTLSISASVIDNTGGAIKVADESRLSVSGNLTGGTLQSLGNTAVISGGQYASATFSGDFNYQSASFADVAMSGMSVLTGTSYLSGSLSNTGTLTVGNNSSYGVLYFGADTVLKGSGQTVLNSNGHVYASGTNAKLTIDADHTVSGNGDISYNGASAVSVINKGTVIADGGTLNISVPVFDNTAGTVKVTDGSRLSVSGVLKGGRLQGGTLGTSLLSGSTLDGVSLSGLLVATGSLDLNNTITNTGTLTVGSNSSSGSLYFGAGTVLKGGGQTVLSSNGHVYASGTNAKLTIDADHTVRGNGDISYNGASAVSVVNNGTVAAENGTLYLSANMSGTGIISVFNGGTFQQNADVQIARVDVRSGGNYQISSGTLETPVYDGSLHQTSGQFGAGLGASVSRMSGNYTLNGGSFAALIGGKAEGQYDQLQLAGSLTLTSGNLSVNNINGYDIQSGDVFDLIRVGGTSSGNFSGLAEGSGISVGGRTLYLTYFGGDGNDVSLVSTFTAGSTNLGSGQASSNSYAYVVGTYPAVGTPRTTDLKGLDILAGGSYTLGVDDVLNLDGGNGVLNVSQGAVFTGNGVIRGHVRNAGLVRIPIVNLGHVSGGQVRIVMDQPVIQTTAPVVVNRDTYVGFSHGGGGGGGGGGGAGGGGGGGGGSIATPSIVRLQEAAPVVRGTFAVDASLEVTGSFTQESTGALRLFVGGNDRASFGSSRSGGTYSQLFVGEAVSMDGALEIVLQPELFARFNYAPHIGDTFDFVIAEEGITLASGLDYRFFVTDEGRSFLSQSGLTLSAYNSGIAADPDHLYQIAETLFRFDLVNGGTVLRGTLIKDINVTAVPEPGAYVLALAGLAVMAWMGKKRQMP